MKRHVSALKTSFAISICLGLLACETSSDNSLEQARQCTDNAAKLSLSNPSTAAGIASGCEAIVVNNNLQTPEAYKVWFGITLIEDQLISNIAQAAQAKSSNSGGKDGLATMLPLLTISSTTDGNNATQESTKLQNIANGSGKASLIEVAGMIKMAVTLNTLTSLITGNPGNTQTALTNCAGDPTCSAGVQSSFNSMAASACASPTDNASTDPNNMCVKAKAIQNLAGPNPSATALVNAINTYTNSTH